MVNSLVNSINILFTVKEVSIKFVKPNGWMDKHEACLIEELESNIKRLVINN